MSHLVESMVYAFNHCWLTNVLFRVAVLLMLANCVELIELHDRALRGINSLSVVFPCGNPQYSSFKQHII